MTSPLGDQTTVVNSLDLVEPLLMKGLVSKECLEHARKVAALFPINTVSFFGFETRLADEQNLSTDCALNFTPLGAELLSRGQLGYESETWKKVWHFYQCWANSHTEPFADAPATWLEFDSGPQEPTPNLLFGYWPDDSKTNRPWPWMQETIFPMLFGGNYGSNLHDCVEHCFQALPEGTGDFQIGLMLARPIQALRLCVFDIPINKVPAYLQSIHWQGNIPTLEKYLAAFAPYCDFVGLHLDIASQVLPHIGIEPNFKAGSWARQPHLEKRWHGLFEQLANANLLSDSKHAALLDWVGHQHVQYTDQPSLLLRGLSHLKVVMSAEGVGMAKAYFGIANSAATLPE